MTGTTYTIELDEGNADLKILNNANYQFGLAKSVNSGNGPTFNTVWVSNTDLDGERLGNTNVISWTDTYALNYTFSVPAQGASVTGGGEWQTMNLGDYYAIDANGAWVAGTPPVSPQSNSLNISANDYQSVHIVVGLPVIDGSGKITYQPTWVDETPLLFKSTGSYEPTEEIKLWFSENQVTGTVIGNQDTQVETYALLDTNKVYFWYDVQNGAWSNQTSGPFSPP